MIKVANHDPAHLFFRWIVLRIVIWLIFGRFDHLYLMSLVKPVLSAATISNITSYGVHYSVIIEGRDNIITSSHPPMLLMTTMRKAFMMKMICPSIKCGRIFTVADTLSNGFKNQPFTDIIQLRMWLRNPSLYIIKIDKK